MRIIKQYITKSDNYNTSKKITPVGIMIHSPAAPGVTAAAFASRWDKPGFEKGVHAFVDDKDAYIILPCEPGNVHRAWHCGKGKHGSGNDMLIGIEVCESKDLADKAYFAKAYANAVELAVYFCRLFPAIMAQNIICHAEGYQAGIASNHADINHWWPLHGVDMDNFRSDVAARLAGSAAKEQAPAVTQERPAAGQKELYRVQVGAFKSPDNAKAMQERLCKQGYDTIIKLVDGLYKVQTGAFAVLANAEAMRDKLQAAGFPTFLRQDEAAVAITTKAEDPSYAEWPGVCTTNSVNVRTGPGTSYPIYKAWPKLGKGNQIDVIGEEAAGNGKTWYKILIANEHETYVYGGYIKHA